jgi:uncharacterized protein (TIGR03435 family)
VSPVLSITGRPSSSRVNAPENAAAGASLYLLQLWRQHLNAQRRHTSQEAIDMGWYVLFVAAIAALPAGAQARFEVASIRPAPPDTAVQDRGYDFRGDRFEAKALTVGEILDMLGGWQLYRVIGGPPWMRTDRYDIEAKADRVLDRDIRESAVMGLLALRFHLESHNEKREAPGIVLRAPKTPPGVKHAADGEHFSILRNGQTDMVFTAVPMSSVTSYLSSLWGAPVADETGMQGAWDFVAPTSRVDPQAVAQWGDRVREALMALGFRVEDRRIPLEVTVVDRCERPTPN